VLSTPRLLSNLPAGFSPSFLGLDFSAQRPHSADGLIIFGSTHVVFVDCSVLVPRLDSSANFLTLYQCCHPSSSFLLFALIICHDTAAFFMFH